MAGDWIKIEHAMPDKPEIVRMSQLLEMDQDAVSGKCLRLWIWADQQTMEGYALSVTTSFIDRLTYCAGFAEALRKVGWLEGREGHLSIPNFSRHNGQTAKNRALSKDRMKRKRDGARVTESSPEKRRKEKSIKKKTTSSKKFIPPTVAEVADYCRSRGNSVDPQTFVDHYEANGWMRGKSKVKDWMACVRTWEKNDNGTRQATRPHAEAQREQANASVFNRFRAAAAAQRAAVLGDAAADTGTPMLDEAARDADRPPD